MSTDVNLARSVMAAPSFSQASIREVGGALLEASDMGAAATALAAELSAAGIAPHEALDLGCRRFGELLDRDDKELVFAAFAELEDRSEKLMREGWAAICRRDAVMQRSSISVASAFD